MHHPRMLRARTRVTLAACATLTALAALAGLARPALADGGLPTPLPSITAGPSTQTLLAAAAAHGLKCDPYAGPNGPEYSCFVEVVPQVYYSAEFYDSPSLVMALYISGPLPWPDDHDAFLVDMTELFCGADQADAIAA